MTKKISRFCQKFVLNFQWHWKIVFSKNVWIYIYIFESSYIAQEKNFISIEDFINVKILWYLARNSHALDFLVVKNFYLRGATNCLFAQRLTSRMCGIVRALYRLWNFPPRRPWPRPQFSSVMIRWPWIVLAGRVLASFTLWKQSVL